MQQADTRTDDNVRKMDASGDRHSLDERYVALADQRRRHVLNRLQAAEGPITLSGLAEELVQPGPEDEDAAVPAEAAHRTYLSLYHCHVPKLAEAGLVRFDEETERVDLAAGEWLEQVQGDD